MSNKEIGSYCPSNKEDWRLWLQANHKKVDAVWLICYKKSATRTNLSWGEAVDEALCFGWIDSVKKTIDKDRYKQYYSKRKPTSTWSKINKEKVACFIEKNLMSEEGLKTIEIAKRNGSWTLLDSVEALIAPIALIQAFEQHEGAQEYYESRSNSIKKLLLSWIALAKLEETKTKRIKLIAENACEQQLPKPLR